MADSFSYDLSTNVGRVRFELGDTDAENKAFSDAEISHAISTAGSHDGAMALLIRALLNGRARRARLFATPADGQSVYDDATSIAALERMLAVYGGDVAALPVATIGTLGAHPSDPCWTGTPRRGCC